MWKCDTLEAAYQETMVRWNVQVVKNALWVCLGLDPGQLPRPWNGPCEGYPYKYGQNGKTSQKRGKQAQEIEKNRQTSLPRACGLPRLTPKARVGMWKGGALQFLRGVVW